MFVSVFKHMVSISDGKMANTCFTFFLTFPGDVPSRGWWGGTERVLFCFAFDNSGSHGKAPRKVREDPVKTLCRFYSGHTPEKPALLARFSGPAALPALPCPLQGAGGWLACTCEPVSAAKNLSSWNLDVDPLVKRQL